MESQEYSDDYIELEYIRASSVIRKEGANCLSPDLDPVEHSYPESQVQLDKTIVKEKFFCAEEKVGAFLTHE
jgi:hypothetical protein